ncbi:MAG: CehA/McbA family metallohydrolase [Deltaproteobacteria bacterium]|nr:CehA/McbA family metallohydrolase [Deltaproteobacteria bacterium]
MFNLSWLSGVGSRALGRILFSALLVASVAASGCGDDGGGGDAGDAGDAAVDTGPPPVDLELTAPPDPAEPTGCAETRPGAGEVWAKHIECAAELLNGPLAMGHAGDLLLENEHVRFVVRGGTGAAMVQGGPFGCIVDAAFGEHPDSLKEVFPVFGLATMAASEIAVIDAGVTSGEARVRVLFEDALVPLIDSFAPGLGRAGIVRGQLDYVLGAGDRALRIEYALTTRPGIPVARAAFGMLPLLGAQEVTQPGYGILGEDGLGGDGAFLVAERDDDAVAFGFDTVVSAAQIQTIHVLLATSPSVMQTGELTRFTARLAPAATAAEALSAVAADPADTGDAMIELQGPPGDRVEVRDAEGVLYLRTRLDASGAARFPAPPGAYRARAGYRGFFPGAEASFDHGACAPTAVTVAAPPSATLTVSATADGDATAPVRVTVVEGVEQIDRYIAIGPTDRRLPPGDYTVHVSRGMEFDVFAVDLTLAPAATEMVDPVLPRVVDTTGWVSADLHLHTEMSVDSLRPIEDAVRMLAAEGLDVASSTEHDVISDYRSIVVEAGVADYLLVVNGAEVSSTHLGHINGYPLAHDPALSAFGAPLWFDKPPGELFAAIRAAGDESLGGALVQVNHPRSGRKGLFSSIGFDRETLLSTVSPVEIDLDPGANLDDFSFDTIEVWNGGIGSEDEEAFEDYLALYAGGQVSTMVGNSDSHFLGDAPGGPRTFVEVPDDSPGAFAWPDVAASLRSGDATVAGGIFVTAEAAGPAVGDTVTVQVRIQAAPWVPVDRLRIYAGRRVAVDQAVAATADVLRFDAAIDVTLEGADFIVVRVDGAGAPRPYQSFDPYGVTNAVVVP